MTFVPRRGRNKGYLKYKADAQLEGMPFVGRTKFYEHEHQKLMGDSKAEGGLCCNCERYGVQCFANLGKVVRSVYSKGDPRRAERLDTLKELSAYFCKGGGFFQKLQLDSTCIQARRIFSCRANATLPHATNACASASRPISRASLPRAPPTSTACATRSPTRATRRLRRRAITTTPPRTRCARRETSSSRR